jgi:hypothetical protein
MVASWLGFTATESTVNGLERIRLRSSDVAAAIHRCLSVLNDSVLGPALTHVSLATGDVIDCLANPLTRQWLDQRRLKKASAHLPDYVEKLFGPINILLAAKMIDVNAARKMSWLSPNQRTSRWVLPYLNRREHREVPCRSCSGAPEMAVRIESVSASVCLRRA